MISIFHSTTKLLILVWNRKQNNDLSSARTNHKCYSMNGRLVSTVNYSTIQNMKNRMYSFNKSSAYRTVFTQRKKPTNSTNSYTSPHHLIIHRSSIFCDGRRLEIPESCREQKKNADQKPVFEELVNHIHEDLSKQINCGWSEDKCWGSKENF